MSPCLWSVSISADHDITESKTRPNHRVTVGAVPLVSARRKAREAVLVGSTRMAPSVVSLLPGRVKRLLAGAPTVVDGNVMDSTLQVLVASRRRMGATGLIVDDDVALSRRLLLVLGQSFGGRPEGVDVSELSMPGPGGAIAMRHYRSADADAPALLYFHGGAYVLGDLDTYDAVCRMLCRDAGVHVFAPEYRLAPEHVAPAAVDDCLAAYRWVCTHAGDIGAPPGRVAVGGDSAGGGLAAAVAHLAHADGDNPDPLLQLLIYPWLDLLTPTRSRTLFDGIVLNDHDFTSSTNRYLDGSRVSADDPRVSPARAESLSGLAPALVVTAGFDPLRDEGNAYAAALAAAGVPVDLREMGSMVHGFINFDGVGGATSVAIAEVTSALRAHLRRAEA
jgi:acetyl esterase